MKSKNKRLLDKLNKFALENNISDNCGGPVKDIERIMDDVHRQINKSGECIIYILKRNRGDYYHVIYGKL